MAVDLSLCTRCRCLAARRNARAITRHFEAELRPHGLRATQFSILPALALVATRKGAWLYSSDAGRRSWRADGPHFLGHIVSHVVLDPRDGRTLLAAAKTGHLGPTIFRSTDLGRHWKEAARPPAFPKAQNGE